MEIYIVLDGYVYTFNVTNFDELPEYNKKELLNRTCFLGLYIEELKIINIVSITGEKLSHNPYFIEYY